MLTCTTPARAFTNERRDLARDLHACATQIHVEGDQRPPRADDHAAGSLVQPRRTERRLDLTCVDAPLQLFRAATPKERWASAGAELAVQEHGQFELLAEAPSDVECARPRPLHVLADDRDDRHDVGHADPRMRSLMAT